MVEPHPLGWFTLVGFRITIETNLCACLRVSFNIKLTEVGRPTLNMGGSIPWAGVLD